MVPLAVIALAVRAVSLDPLLAALAPLIVLHVETAQPGSSEWAIAEARFAFTTRGRIIAVAPNFVLLPSWNRSAWPWERAAIGVHGVFARAALACLVGDTTARSVDAARRAVGLSSHSLEASINRSLTEPGVAGRGPVEAARVIDAALRRFAGRLSAMSSVRDWPRSCRRRRSLPGVIGSAAR